MFLPIPPQGHIAIFNDILTILIHRSFKELKKKIIFRIN